MNTKLTEFGERLVKLHTGAMGLRAMLEVKATPDEQDADLLHMRASDETIDRYRETISAAGWCLDNYQKNPVIQNAHQYGDIIFTIGRAEKTWVQDGALMQTWRFASAANPMAKIARDLYRGKFLNASSVGFIPREWEMGKDGEEHRRRYLKQELLEVSAVGIPANPNALSLAVKSGAVEKSDLRALAEILQAVCRGNPTLPEEVKNPKPILVLEILVPETKWLCPHCSEEILEKHLWGWDDKTRSSKHVDCGGWCIYPPSKDADLWKQFRSDNAAPQSHTGALGLGRDGAQLLQEINLQLAEVAKRTC